MVSGEDNQNVPSEIFDGSGEVNPTFVGANRFVFTIDMGESGTKQLLRLTFMGEGVDSLTVAATEDSDEATEESVVSANLDL